MTVALPVFFYILATIFVLVGEPFGTIYGSFGIPTCLGILIFSVFGLILLQFHGQKYQLKVVNVDRCGKLVTFFSLIVMVWLLIVLHKYGQPASFYLFKGELPPNEILHGAYRDRLPLRAFFPPLVLAVMLTTTLCYFHDKTKIIWLILISIITVCFIAIYETRHVMLWFVIYILNARFIYINSLQKLKLKYSYIAAIISVLILFVVLGNARSGVTFAGSEQFALAMAVDEGYAKLPMILVWAIIYLFSSIACGISNDPFTPFINYDIPIKLLPGFLQGLTTSAFSINVSDRFSAQMFAIDAWHTYLIQFGIFLSLPILTTIFGVYTMICFKLNKILKSGQSVPGWFFAIYLWYSARICLMFIGDYFFDFGAIVELSFLIVLFKLIRIKICPSPSLGYIK